MRDVEKPPTGSWLETSSAATFLSVVECRDFPDLIVLGLLVDDIEGTPIEKASITVGRHDNIAAAIDSDFILSPSSKPAQTGRLPMLQLVVNSLPSWRSLAASKEQSKCVARR